MAGYPVNDKLELRTDLWRISPHCFSEEIRSKMTLPKKLQICDITLREGRQLPGVSLRLDDVLLIADKLVECGVSMLQMHHDDPQEMEQVKKRHPNVIIEALVHPTAVLNPEMAKVEVDLNFDHGADYTTLCFSFSPEQMCLFESMAEGRITIEDAIDRAMGSVQYARKKAGKNRKVGCLIQDCTRIPIERLAEVCGKLVAAGADMIKLDDINGMAIYPVYTHVVREMKRLLPGTEIGLHTHNDIGLATASLYAGLEGGADLIDVCVNGLGERAHIAPMAEVVSVIQIYYGIDCGIKLDKLYELSKLVSDVMKWPMTETMPFVGQDRVLASGRGALLRSADRGGFLGLSVHEAGNVRQQDAQFARPLFRSVGGARQGARDRRQDSARQGAGRYQKAAERNPLSQASTDQR